MVVNEPGLIANMLRARSGHIGGGAMGGGAPGRNMWDLRTLADADADADDGHVVRLEPLPAEHTARSGLQLRPPARWAATHAADRTERDLDDPVPRIVQRQDGRPCVGFNYAIMKPFQLVLEYLECALQRRSVVLKSDIFRHAANCIARLEPTCEVLGAPVRDVRSELDQDEVRLIQFEEVTSEGEPTVSSDGSPRRALATLDRRTLANRLHPGQA